ncbi:conserved hypothetical protein, membrane [Candidatus Desulfofervidus auxilii]|uniref:DUF6311 domain-containing protein n=1 Tax=Desulfofervidus auxilii TaxID=1621989 RepID=A0A7U4QML0_DESA2|nr:hypothetical protein [Candidatus Desulfofervidus auxilii]AMM42131.1 conserved hypothetical protein, membrane [Candidatus Desulfofervidus auxilii]
MINEKKTLFIVLIGYVFITLLMTYPLVFHLTTHIPGDAGDGHQNLWNIWHFKKRLLNFQNPFYTNYLYYPIGVKLIFHTYGVFNNLLVLPFNNIVLAYNFIVLFSFVMSAMGMYFLSFYLTQDKFGSFIAGVIFSFCPYKFAHLLGHLNLVSTEWIPFYILYLIKTFKEPFSYKNICLASIFFLSTILCSYYYVFYLIIFTTLFFTFEVKNRIFTKRTFFLILFIFISVFPLLVMGFQAYLEGDFIKGSGYKQFSADLLAFFIPSPLHPLFGPYVKPIYSAFRAGGTEGIVFMGYIVLALFIYSVLSSQRKKLKFWLISALCFFILSLGPMLQIYGHGIFLLPYQPLYHLPLIGAFRVPSRFDIMLTLCLAIIAGYQIKLFLSKFSLKKRFILTSIFSAFIIFEYAAFPYPLDPWPSSRLAHDIKPAFKGPSKGSILFIPFGDCGQYGAATLMYFQTIFNRPMLGGYISRTPPWLVNYYENAPIIGTIKKLARGNQVSKERIIKDRELIEEMIRLYNIQYIVGIKEFLNESLIEYCTTIFSQHVISCKKLDDILIICPLRPIPPSKGLRIDFSKYASKLYIIKGLTDGLVSEKHIKLAQKKGSFLILPPLGKGSHKLILKMKSFTDKGEINIFLNKEKVLQRKLSKGNLVFEFKPSENLAQKHNFLELKYKNVPSLKKSDYQNNFIYCPDKKALPLSFISLEITSNLPSLPQP